MKVEKGLGEATAGEEEATAAAVEAAMAEEGAVAEATVEGEDTAEDMEEIAETVDMNAIEAQYRSRKAKKSK
jgi:hypothetical protein